VPTDRVSNRTGEARGRGLFPRLPSRRSGLWAAVIVVAFPSSVRAQDADVSPIPDPEPALDGPHDPFGFGVKRLAYSLGLKVAEVFDDNVLLERDRKTSDQITVFLLSAKLRHEYAAGAAQVAYRGRERLFARHDEFNGLEHFLTANGTFESRPVRFEAGLEWRDLKDPFDALQVTGHRDSRFDREYLKASADFSRFDVEVTAGLAHFAIDDELLDRGDYRRWEFTVTGLADAWPQVALLAEFGIQGTDYAGSEFSDFTFTRLAAGARGSLTPKTRTEARVGIGRADPESGGLFPVEAVTSVVAEVSFAWDIDEKQELKVDLRREPIESVVTGLAVADGLHVGYRRTIAERWTVQGLVSWDRQRESDGSGNRWGLQARAGVRWVSTGRVFADLGFLVRNRESDNPALEYENFRFSIGVGVQW